MKYFDRVLRVQRWLPQVLILLFALGNGLGAQQAPPLPQTSPPPQASPAPQTKPMAPLPTVKDLKLIPLAGDGEMNDLERKIMAPLVIEVLEQNDRPIEGADVVFRFPLKGPGAVFAGEKTSQRVRTNAQGQAAALGWVANNEVGSFEVHVTATYGNEMGETTLTMSNVTRIVDDVKKKKAKHASFWSSRTFKIVAIVGGAALVAGIVLATRGGGHTTNTATPPTITITPGAPTVGGPH